MVAGGGARPPQPPKTSSPGTDVGSQVVYPPLQRMAVGAARVRAKVRVPQLLLELIDALVQPLRDVGICIDGLHVVALSAETPRVVAHPEAAPRHLMLLLSLIFLSSGPVLRQSRFPQLCPLLALPPTSEVN